MTAHNDKAQPQVGIFWVVKSKLILKGVTLDEAEPCGRFFNAIGHDSYWGELQVAGAVPGDVEYDEPPRGRVVYDVIADRFHLYADRCILADKKLIEEIIAQLRLAKQRIKIAPDLHYRCTNCLRVNDK
ncbi:MAG: hypothetical protein ABR881_26085 [Candidatus Sulfotelmatobacter sp.]|jgi:hypothetical protein